MPVDVTAPPSGLQPAGSQQEPFEQAFSTIPIVDDPSPPERTTQGLVSDLADFALDATPEEAAYAPGGVLADERDLFFDFEGDEPVGAPGPGIWLSGTAAILQWCEKALMTPRGKFAIYPPEYGSEIKRMVGEAMPDAVLHSEIARTVTECLLYNVHVLDVKVLSVRRAPLVGEGVVIINLQLSLDTTASPVNVSLRG